MDMNSHLKNLTRTFWVLTLLGLFISCVDTIPKRSTITSGSTLGDTLVCPEGQEVATEVVNGVETQVCKDSVYKRPDGAIFWKADFCACKDTKPVSYGNCATFCSNKNTAGAETLFASFTVSDAIALNTDINTIYKWCNKTLGTDTANPSCELQAKDDQGHVSVVDVVVSPTTNSLTANIQDKISYDKTYVLTLVEKTSGSKSNSVQIVKFSPDVGLPVLGPLKNTQVSQYSCIVRQFSDLGDIDSIYRLHFYFIPRVAPDAVPGDDTRLICHDYQTHGTKDDVSYPRFELTPGIFNLWDTMDPRFYDINGNGTLDINDAIIQKTKNFGGTVAAGTNFFREFPKQMIPQDLLAEAGNDANTSQSLGYFMSPWIDQTTFKSYCLNSTHYNSTNALFKAMRDYLGVDTEGIYIGEKAAETVTDSSGATVAGIKDYIWIRETDLKAVWFYLKAGVPTVPTDDNVASNTILFYYPLNKASPFVKTSTQRTFRVRSAQEIAGVTSGSTSTGTNTSYPAHDRKYGCVPKF
jgi:hypothetical protein